MSNNIVEMARFRLAAGVGEASFFKEAEAVQKSFLEKQSGYIDRELLKGEDGEYMDILHWASIAEAQQAAEAMMEDPSAVGFMQRIDPASIKMMHLSAIRAWKTPGP